MATMRFSKKPVVFCAQILRFVLSSSRFNGCRQRGFSVMALNMAGL